MITELDVMFRIGIAIVCGLLIGLERQITGHAAGIKTNILISFGSCAFVLFAFLVDSGDKTRIAAQVVTGVGFLCSSVIMKNGISVNGINTSATIWCTSAIGILSSLGMWKISLIITMTLIISNLIFYPIAEKIPVLRKYNDDTEERIYKLCVSCVSDNVMEIRKLLVNTLDETEFVLTGIELKTDETSPIKKTNIKATLNKLGKIDNKLLETIVTKLCEDERVLGVNWKLS